MNVKSYLKGIGVGMIVASLILIIAGNMNKVSDEDVIARAKELGYVQSTTVTQPEVVDNTSSNTEQNKIEDSEKVESTENNNAANADDKSTDVNANDNANVEDETNDANSDSNAKESVNADNSTETANTTDDDKTVSDNADKTASTTSSETVKVEIRSGMSSESAALAVKNAGLVESDTEFNKYLCSEGYDKRLRVGSFDIPKDADFETIAKSLCGMN